MKTHFTKKDVPKCWAELANKDAKTAYKAVLRQRVAKKHHRWNRGLRIGKILSTTRETSPFSFEELRSVRAVEILERIETPEAKRVLARLAKGLPTAVLTQEAKASCRRLATHSMK